MELVREAGGAGVAILRDVTTQRRWPSMHGDGRETVLNPLMSRV